MSKELQTEVLLILMYLPFSNLFPFFFFVQVNTTNGHSSAAQASDISHLVRKKVRELASGFKNKIAYKMCIRFHNSVVSSD